MPTLYEKLNDLITKGGKNKNSTTLQLGILWLEKFWADSEEPSGNYIGIKRGDGDLVLLAFQDSRIGYQNTGGTRYTDEECQAINKLIEGFTRNRYEAVREGPDKWSFPRIRYGPGKKDWRFVRSGTEGTVQPFTRERRPRGAGDFISTPVEDVYLPNDDDDSDPDEYMPGDVR